MPDLSQSTLNILTMAKRAGRLVPGFDSVKEEIIAKKAACVYITSDISEKTKKEIIFYSDKYEIPCLELDITMNDTEHCFRKRVGVFSTGDEGFAKAIKKLYV